MGWPFVAFVAVLAAAYCFCRWLDHMSPASLTEVVEEDDVEEDDDDVQDDEQRTS